MATTLDDIGPLENDFSQEEVPFQEEAQVVSDFHENLAELIDFETAQHLADRVIQDYEMDRASRHDWEQRLAKGMDLLGVDGGKSMPIPFEGACTAVHPMIPEAAIDYISRAAKELLPPQGPAKCKVLGKEDEAKRLQARRVQDYINYQVTEEIPDFFDDTERLLLSQALTGSAFRKWSYDPLRESACASFVPVEDFVINFFGPDIHRSERYTHREFITQNEMSRRIVSELYRDGNVLISQLGTEEDELSRKVHETLGIVRPSDEEVYEVLEQHTYLILPPGLDPLAPEVPAPYIVSVDKGSQELLSIRRNWFEGDTTYKKRLWFAHYKFVPSVGCYGWGLIHLIGDIARSTTAALRSFVDAAMFATLPAGFRLKDFRITEGDNAFSFGEFKEIEATGDDISKMVMRLPIDPPSEAHLRGIEFLSQTGTNFANKTAEALKGNYERTPVGTALAVLEGSAKFFSAIHKRNHRAMATELRILSGINFDFLPRDYYPYLVHGDNPHVFKQDFDRRNVDVVPVSDPNIPSAAHKLSLLQAQLGLAQQAPQMYNQAELHRQVFEAMGLDNSDKVLTPLQKPEPSDPMTDILKVVRGVPIAAFPDQDHAAHIAFKTAWLQDPAQGNSETMGKIKPLVEANVRQHQALLYMEQIGGLMQGAPQQPGTQERFMAESANTILAANQRLTEDEADTRKQELEEMRLLLDTKIADDEREYNFAKLSLDRMEIMFKNQENAEKQDLEAVREANKALDDYRNYILARKQLDRQDSSPPAQRGE